jgi:hypothetical protein
VSNVLHDLTGLIQALSKAGQVTEIAPGSYEVSSWCGQPLRPPTVLQVDDEGLSTYLSTNQEDAQVAFGTDAERAPFSLLMSELTEAMESRDVAPLQVAVREGRVDVVRGSAAPREHGEAPGDFTWRLDGLGE